MTKHLRLNVFLFGFFCCLTNNSFAQQASSLDLSFNGSGTYSLTVPMNTIPQVNSKVTLQNDGKILICGNRFNGNNNEIMISRLLPNGILDNTFGNTGTFNHSILPNFHQCVGLQVQADGKIVGAGFFNNGNDNEIFVVRLKSNGIIDSTFGINGFMTNNISPLDEKITDMQLMSDGKIAICGFIQSDSAFVIRCLSNGILDNTFANTGLYMLKHNGENTDIYAIAELPSKALLVAGSNYTNTNYQDVFAMKLDSLGGISANFGNAGYFLKDITNDYDEIHDIKILPSGEILLAGYSYNGNNDGALVIKINDSGALVNTFASNGILNYTFNNTPSRAYSLDVQSNGKIVLGGEYADTVSGLTDYYLLRINDDGMLDSTFNVTLPYVTFDFNAENDNIGSIIIQPDGKILTYGLAVLNNLTQETLPSLARFVGDSIVIISGINENNSHTYFIKLYPNPTAKLLNIETELDEWIDYSIYDLQGNNVLHGKYLRKTSINVESLNNGCYFLKASNETKTNYQTIPFVKHN